MSQNFSLKFINNSFKKFFILYLVTIYLIAIYYLFDKHNSGLDSTISEWLINYFSGFTRRGLAGHIFAEISIIFNIPIRFIIFLFQCVVYLIFLSLIFFYFYDLKKNYFLS